MTKRTIKKIGLSNSIVTKDCWAQYDNHRISYWFVSAALQEQSRRFSTYAYGLDNPIRFIDPDGMKATDWYLPEGSKVPVFDSEIESQQNLDDKKIAGKYLGKSGFMVDADGNTKYYHTDGKVYGAYPLKEAKITAKKKSVKGGDKVQSGGGYPGQVNYNGYNVSSEVLQRKLMQFSQYAGQPIDVTSGDRSAARNKSAGGAKASRHLFGDAVDIKIQGMTNRQVSILANRSALFNTVIYYPQIDAAGALKPHVHLDLNPTHNNLFLLYTPLIIDGTVTKNKYSPFR